MEIIGKYENGNIAVKGGSTKYRVRVEDATVVVGNVDLFRVVDGGKVVNLKARRSHVPELVADNIREALALAKTV